MEKKLYKPSDILHFKNYIFTDNNTSAPHFALVLLPPSIMDFTSNILCSVITSKPTKYFSVELLEKKYNCFTKNSYVCLNRRDINSVHDLSAREQPLDSLKHSDAKKVFNVLKNIFYGKKEDKYYIATIIREWKKIINK